MGYIGGLVVRDYNYNNWNDNNSFEKLVCFSKFTSMAVKGGTSISTTGRPMRSE